MNVHDLFQVHATCPKPRARESSNWLPKSTTPYVSIYITLCLPTTKTKSILQPDVCAAKKYSLKNQTPHPLNRASCLHIIFFPPHIYSRMAAFKRAAAPRKCVRWSTAGVESPHSNRIRAPSRWWRTSAAQPTTRIHNPAIIFGAATARVNILSSSTSRSALFCHSSRTPRAVEPKVMDQQKKWFRRTYRAYHPRIKVVLSAPRWFAFRFRALRKPHMPV